jgi:hypoxanthine phosphoribosyltransferase
LVAVLKGAAVFVADLLRHLTVECEVSFLTASSYGSATSSSGVVRLVSDVDVPLAGSDILVVEDIVESGLTLQYLMRELAAREPASLEACSLLLKPSRDCAREEPRYFGFRIPDRFVVGYGLDYVQRYRNLPYIAELNPAAPSPTSRALLQSP